MGTEALCKTLHIPIDSKTMCLRNSPLCRLKAFRILQLNIVFAGFWNSPGSAGNYKPSVELPTNVFGTFLRASRMSL